MYIYIYIKSQNQGGTCAGSSLASSLAGAWTTSKHTKQGAQALIWRVWWLFNKQWSEETARGAQGCTNSRSSTDQLLKRVSNFRVCAWHKTMRSATTMWHGGLEACKSASWDVVGLNLSCTIATTYIGPWSNSSAIRCTDTRYHRTNRASSCSQQRLLRRSAVSGPFLTCQSLNMPSLMVQKNFFQLASHQTNADLNKSIHKSIDKQINI